jgi:hypothetical protein
MKGITAFFLALIVATSAMAHGSHGSPGGDSSGLSAGLEFGLDIHPHDDGDDDEHGIEVAPNAAVSLSYSEGFFDDKLEFDIALSYIFNFKKGHFELEHEYDYAPLRLPDEDFFQQVLCLNAGLAYSFDLTYFTTLSLILENDTDFYLSPKIGENNIEGELKPGIKWNWNTGFGDIYVRYDVPLKYVSFFKEEVFGVGSDVSLGWQSKFGLGVDFIGRFLLSPESGFDGVDAIISYELPVKNFTFYITCEFEGIGSEEGICIVPAIGFRYSF